MRFRKENVNILLQMDRVEQETMNVKEKTRYWERMKCTYDFITSVIHLDEDQDEQPYLHKFLSIACARMLKKFLEL
mgnify:CR=1 FL=1